MDQTTKNKAISKVQSMKALIAFPGPDSINDTTDIGQELDFYFQFVSFYDNYYYFDLIKFSKFKFEIMAKHQNLRKPRKHLHFIYSYLNTLVDDYTNSTNKFRVIYHL